MITKFKSIIDDYKLLLRCLPTMVTVIFVLSVVLMNLMANKIIFQISDIAAGDGGFLLSWIPFLCMDSVTKRYGARASIMLNILGAVINIACVLLFSAIAALPGNGEDFSAFNYIFGGVWFIVLGSMVAYVASGVVNSLLNAAIGKLFKKNPDGKLAYFSRAYISTFIGQSLDNFLFAFIVYYIFAPIYWGWGFTLTICIGAALCGGIMELFMETLFSPIGYAMCKKWDEADVGTDWIKKYGSELR